MLLSRKLSGIWAFVNQGKDDGHSELFYDSDADQRVVGNEAFVKTVVKERAPGDSAPVLSELIDYVCRLQALDK